MISTVDEISARGFRGGILPDEPMSRHTSLRVGGPADLFAVPEDVDDLLTIIRILSDENCGWMVLGGGYNLLVRDGGIRGAVISLEKINRIEQLDDVVIKACAGAENLQVVRFAQQAGLGGIGFISGIPGTIGGAVRMNAGAYGEGILSRAISITILRDGAVQEIPIASFSFGYRSLALEADEIILAATLALEKRAAEETEDEIRKDLELRRTKHNVGYPSAGSFFKNPEGIAAWRLIDAAGFRGALEGGAMVSEVHSNFLVNRGGATASDFISLSARVRQGVMENSGVLLEEEVRILGEDE